MAEATDDRLTHGALQYIDSVRPLQERLHRALTQLSGYSLMLMLGTKRNALSETAILQAEESLGRVEEGVRSVRVPPAALHHHHHLRAACIAALSASELAGRCGLAGASDLERDRLTRALRVSTENLRLTSRILPGFEMADLAGACCAFHRPAARHRAETNQL